VRARLSYANVMSSLAVFIALGGSSYAAVKITGKDVKDNSLTGADIRRNSISGSDIRASAVNSDDIEDGSLLAQDFRAGQLPRGEAGPRGPKGDTGSVDTSNFYDKAQSDARFLAAAGKATDADQLDGLDSSAFTRGSGRIVNTGGTIPETSDNAQMVADLGAFQLVVHCRDAFGDYVRLFDTSSQQMIVYTDDGSGTPVRDIFISGAAGDFTSATDRVEFQAVRRFNPAVAMTAVVTLADTGNECEYVVQATSTG
jgi:hypothetical protein